MSGTSQAPESVTVLAAEWVLPVETSPILDGAVVVQGDRIAWVGERWQLPSRFVSAPVRVFPRSLLLPGWVNAHCHLNLTAALGGLKGHVDDFAGWLRQVIRLQESWPEEILLRSIQAGLDLLLSTGTTTCAHSSAYPPVEAFLTHPMRTVLFHEPIGFPASRASQLLTQAQDWLDAAEALVQDGGSDRIRFGLAPHAPYTFSKPLIRGLLAMAEARALPISVHLAETPAELQFTRDGTGPLRQLLEERNAWDADWTPPGVTPVRYARDLGLLERPGLAVHCNYLSAEDEALLDEARLTPTWCPGSHLYFGHGYHPVGARISRGKPVALGTDSAASNRGLNMLREVRLAGAAFEEVPAAAWVKAATLNAAVALGLSDQVGSLAPGKLADLQVLGGLPAGCGEPLASLMNDRLQLRLVMVGGVETTPTRPGNPS